MSRLAVDNRLQFDREVISAFTVQSIGADEMKHPKTCRRRQILPSCMASALLYPYGSISTLTTKRRDTASPLTD
jgi:hypothetical protein